MSIKAEIIADSINPVGNRLTTFVLEYPRFVHAEFMTHRMFSKNAASSRAIPIEKMIQQVKDNPALPEFWGKNQSGMQANEELDNIIRQGMNDYGEEVVEFEDLVVNRWTADKDEPARCYNLTLLERAKFKWLKSRNIAIRQVKELNELGLHKQITNRLLEPWFHIRVICSATEFENFFALRCHLDAQPEIRTLAEKMLEAYNNSTPKVLKLGAWHIPFGENINVDKIFETDEWIDLTDGVAHEWSGDTNYYLDKVKVKIAIARCARISYLNYEGKDDYNADIKLCDRLFGSNPKHLSPTEHVAQALDKSEFIGNFCGFKQYRKFFADENLKDNRVIKR